MAVPTFPDPRFHLVLPPVHNNEVPLPLLDNIAGDWVFFKHNREIYNVLQGRMDVACSFPKVCVVLLGTLLGSRWITFLQAQEQGVKAQLSQKLLDHNNIFCLREVHGRTSFFKPSRYWLLDSTLKEFLPDKTREDQLFAFIGIFYLMRML